MASNSTSDASKANSTSTTINVDSTSVTFEAETFSSQKFFTIAIPILLPCTNDIELYRYLLASRNARIEMLLSRSMGATYCWGIPRGIVLGLGEVGEGMEGGRLRTRGWSAEWSEGEMGR